MARLQLKNINKRWGAFVGVKDLNLDIADEEFLVLLGPSGCGKSTTMRMIAGLEGVSEGEILLGDQVVNHLPPKDRDISMVFQSYGLYPNLSVYENIRFPLRVRRVPKDQHDEMVMRAVRMVELEDFMHRRPAELSGGQRQRVALGRAIVRKPTVFLMDEPLSNLDAKLRVSTRAQIKNLQSKLKVTTVYVTHDQTEAMTLADRVVVMNAGEIQQVGTPTEIYNTPANTFVASFIGSPAMNLIEGVVRLDGGPSVEIGDVRLPVTPRDGLVEGQAVTLGARPEHLELSDTGLPVSVAVVEPTGSETHVIGHLAGKDVTAVFRERHAFAPGDVIHLTPGPAHIHLFDAATGAVLR